MSDFSDSDLETDSRDDIFTQAAEQVQRIHAKLTPNDLLELYAFYKQATVGRCQTTKPGIFDLQGRAKWSAWHDLGDMSSAKAKQLYVEKVQQLDADWHATLSKGVKLKSPNSWAVHSQEMPPDDLEQKAEHEKNAFDYVKERNLQRLQTCLNAEALLEIDEHGMGLIHWATDRNSVEILQFLLDAGADVNQRDAEQQTALHYASSCGHLDCIRLLISFNADRCLKDNSGETCVDVAENAEVRALLQS